ncbi:MAG: hypothetical protein M3077_11185 [Candidatus Dormibacteraeota bacterium]|nr:hypothetical protein [Candidatus Dormibacteraeota bacterium]
MVFGWAVSAAMALISLGLLAFGAYRLSTHGPLTLTLVQLAVSVLGLFLAFRVYRKWQALRVAGPSERAVIARSAQRGGRSVWLVVCALGVVIGLLAVAIGVLSGRENSALLGAGLVAFSLFSGWFASRHFR